MGQAQAFSCRSVAAVGYCGHDDVWMKCTDVLHQFDLFRVFDAFAFQVIHQSAFSVADGLAWNIVHRCLMLTGNVARLV